jgi:hypothetical protein
MVLVGIDPGLKTGVCAWDTKLKKIVFIKTMDFWEVIDYFSQMKHTSDVTNQQVKAVIENSALNKPTFVKPGGNTNLKMQKISRNVGSNQRESVLLIEGVRRLGFSVEEIRPTGKHGVKRKWSAEYFEKLTGISKASQHARDAAMLVFGR